MNVDMLKPNNLNSDCFSSDKFKLSSNATTENIGFQELIASMLGIQLENPVLTSEILEKNEVTETNLFSDENLTENYTDILAFPMQKSLIRMADGMELDTTKYKQMVTIGEMQAIKNIENGENQQNINSLSNDKFDHNLKQFSNLVQKELNIQEISENTSTDAIEHTFKSLQNVQRIKFSSGNNEDSITQNTKKEVNEGLPNNIDNSKTLESNKIHDKAIIEMVDDGTDSKVDQSKLDKNNKNSDSQSDYLSEDMKTSTKSETINNSPKNAVILNTKEITDATISCIRESQSEGSSKMKVSLNPKSLGAIEIEIKFKNNQIEGQIKVVNADVKTQIEQILVSIKEIFKNENLNIKGFNIEIVQEYNNQKFSNQSQQQNDQFNNDQNKRHQTNQNQTEPEVSNLKKFEETQNIMTKAILALNVLA